MYEYCNLSAMNICLANNIIVRLLHPICNMKKNEFYCTLDIQWMLHWVCALQYHTDTRDYWCTLQRCITQLHNKLWWRLLYSTQDSIKVCTKLLPLLDKCRKTQFEASTKLKMTHSDPPPIFWPHTCRKLAKKNTHALLLQWLPWRPGLYTKRLISVSKC